MKTSIRKQITRLIVLVALLGFWTLALHQLGVPSLWYDELFNADLVLGHDVSSIVRVLRFEQPYPPLYYGFLKGWTWLLDVQGYRPGIDPSTGIEFLLRFPSVAAGLIGLAVLAPLGRRVRLPGAAGLPLLLAWHPTFLWYARDARMYAIWLVWAMVALYALAARRKWLWSVSAAAALLTHYFSLFPLAGGALVAWLLERREPDGWGSFLKPRALLWIGSPFVALLLWGWVASRVTFGFASFGTAFPPTPGTFLEELGPDLLTARTFLRTLNGAPSLGLGYGLLLLAALGWLVLVSRAPRRAGILVGALVLGSVLTFVAWQLRPVQHVRYLVWALPLWALGLAALWTVPMARMRYPRAGLVGWLVLAAAGLIWCGAQSLTLLQAPRTTWYPDFRDAIRLLNERAQPGDRGLAVAGHGVDILTAYQSAVSFERGPAIGERLRPDAAAGLVAPGAGRRWLLLFQDDAVDPGGVMVGTFEAAGGRRAEMLYSRELRLYAYTLPEGATIVPLAPQTILDSEAATFEGGVVLRGSTRFQEERLLAVYLFWELLEPQSASLIGAVHLVPEPGLQPIAQQDKPVLSVFWTLPQLSTGEVLPDRYELVIPPTLAPGTYHLFALLYEPETYIRRTLSPGADMVSLGAFVWP